MKWLNSVVVLSCIFAFYVNAAAALPRLRFEITVDNMPVGGFVVEVRPDIVPKTSENFRALCTGEKGFGYKGSTFHRIIPNYMMQGGDYTDDDGVHGRSIYGGKFKDENFILKHTGAATVSMANSGPDSNGSQFIISLVKTSWLDGKNVAFGTVVDGMDIIRNVASYGNQSGKTSRKITISDCYQLS